MHHDEREHVQAQKSAHSELDHLSLEDVVGLKVQRFLDQIGEFYPENLHTEFMRQAERPLIDQVLTRTGGNQVQAAKILGINRNTLRKKMQFHKLS
ncbi:MAG: helix-turn-helix domain-containing protein [Oligoflexales bacterium]